MNRPKRLNTLLWLLSAPLLYLQGGFGSLTVETAKAIWSESVATSGWREYDQARDGRDEKLGPALSDIYSHQPDASYRETDLVCWGHEATHFINNAIRNKLGGGAANGWNAFYVLNNAAMYLREPKIKITDVSRQVPVDLYGPSFHLYLTSRNALAWSDRPCYVLDELTAYSNGAIVAQETNSDQGRCQIDHAFELLGYGCALLDAADRLDPKYPDRKLLVEYLNWQASRLIELAPELGGLPKTFNVLKSQFGVKIPALVKQGAKSWPMRL